MGKNNLSPDNGNWKNVGNCGANLHGQWFKYYRCDEFMLLLCDVWNCPMWDYRMMYETYKDWYIDSGGFLLVSGSLRFPPITHCHICVCIIHSLIFQVCNHSDPTVRLFAADSLTHLIQLALEQVEGSSDSVHQLRLLTPLLVLTQTGHFDVRQRQMECVSHVC